MKYGGLIVETKEYESLMRIMGMAHHLRDNTYKASVDQLLEELKSAKKVAMANMPEDVVRFNSFVTIEIPKGGTRTIQVVMPEKSNVAANRISILAPMGLALFGYAQDDEVQWQFPAGIQSIRLLKVEQDTVEKSVAS